ncbi:hypothetical protein [Anatilimnocola floriformis]|uniref:hypothetical protein n=1 Tax=Anatilimnocola floriformis TaxID=2948575 RepID=UPI0020C385D2|nr:hypothetical protein [Anatilimnocola floriformis]
MKTALKFASWLLMVGMLVITSQAEEKGLEEKIQEEERVEIVTDSRLPLPLPLDGSRWLRYARLTPAIKQFFAPAAQPQQPEESVEVRELTEAQRRIGSVVKGTIFDGIGGSTDAERRQIWQRMAQDAKAADAALEKQIVSQIQQQPVQRVASESGPFNLLQSYSQPVNPTHVAIAQLRLSARNLDQAAADLEDAGKYDEADRIRASANRLRREARDFASEPE